MDPRQSNVFPDYYQPEYNHSQQQQQQQQQQDLHQQNIYHNNLLYHLTQKESINNFSSPLLSSSAKSSSAQPPLFPTYTNSTPCPLPASPPPSQAQFLSLSRRGSACSTNSATGKQVVEAEDFPRARLTRDQHQAFERQFAETPKPNTKIRRQLAQRTGLSIQRVGNWFQNRRAKAKVQKRQEEQHTKQILESAGRRRVTEPSSPVSFNPSRSSTYHQTGDSSSSTNITSSAAASKPRRAKSTTELPKTPASHLQGSMNSSPYDSPAAASYASLERSLAQAEAATARASMMGGSLDQYDASAHLYLNESLQRSSAQFFDGTQSPWPVSHFSDYGSSNATPMYTPTPAGQLEDPFEYDQRYVSSQNHEASGTGHGRCCTDDNFAAFAAAIHDNTMSNTFALPSAPPARFARDTQISPWEAEPSYPVLTRRDSCPSEFIEAFGSVEIKQEPFAPEPAEPTQTESQESLASRRRGPKPMPLRSASLHRRGSVTLPQSAKEPKTAHLLQPSTPMRRIKSTSARMNKCTGGVTKGSPPLSPTGFMRSAGYSPHDNRYTTGGGATIRPSHTSGSFSGTSYTLNQMFSQSGEAPPTPVSPADLEKEEGSGQQSAMEGVAIKFACPESQMSPPQTPCNNDTVEVEGGEEQAGNREDEDRPEDITPRIGYPASSPNCATQDLSSVPRNYMDYREPSMMMDLFSLSMASAEAMLDAEDDTDYFASEGNLFVSEDDLFARGNAFPFDTYMAPSATAHIGDNIF